MPTQWKDYVTHLRLKFQFFLSPIFLMGALLSGEKIGVRLLVAYLSYHLFLYAGITALNSAYDKDEGPVGGLENPPPPPPHLFSFSIVWQLIGFALALAINPLFAASYVVIFVLSFAYSYPRIRLKARPFASVATVALGQGILPFLAAWSLPRGEIASAFSAIGLLGMLAVTAITVGLYPLTAIYQLEEDAQRGDMTLARWLGPRRSFYFAASLIIIGGVSAFLLAQVRFTSIEAAGLVVAIAAILIYLVRWGRAFQVEDIHGNFKRIMALYSVSTLGFILWLGARLVLASVG
jgi:4-hydroxybenzoate polyprenyltransferase